MKKTRGLLESETKRLRVRRSRSGQAEIPRLEETDGSYLARRPPRQTPEKTEPGENAVAKLVVETAFQIHTGLGPGLLESVYEVVLAYELRQLGLKVVRQVPIPIVYKGIQFAEGFRADLIVADCLIVELKSVESLNLVHSKQLLTQLRLTKKRLGLLINFGGAQLKDNVRRVANGLSETTPAL